MLTPWLLAMSVGWTAVIPRRGSAITHASASGGKNLSRSRPSWALLFLGFALALAISFTLIRAGDRRSLLFVGFVSVVVLLLSQEKKPAPRV